MSLVGKHVLLCQAFSLRATQQRRAFSSPSGKALCAWPSRRAQVLPYPPEGPSPADKLCLLAIHCYGWTVHAMSNVQGVH